MSACAAAIVAPFSFLPSPLCFRRFSGVARSRPGPDWGRRESRSYGRFMEGLWPWSVILGLLLATGVGAGSQASLDPEFVRIPPGVLHMGDVRGVGYADERPAHEVRVGGFRMERYEVSISLWVQVYQWAVRHGYEFDDPVAVRPVGPPDHPMTNVSWYDAVKWANARSEKEGLDPVYYLDTHHRRIYRQGQADLRINWVNPSANGFRLPTEAEWEWAARGGLPGQHYAWPSDSPDFEADLDGSQANYWESADPFESDARCATTPVGYYNGAQTPAGKDMANGYGLYDMCGNASEWCWDWYDPQSYETRESPAPDAGGPVSGPGRVLRGGSWISSPKYTRVAARYMSAPGYRCYCYGLRLVRNLPPPP